MTTKHDNLTHNIGKDVFCYACGEERIDENLASHLAHFGIKIEAQQKTAKSLGELVFFIFR